jgi:hypothetical protein
MKIKENFNENQQQLFVASFYCFLNYDKKNDFVIDFDNVWKWLGYTRKSDGKRVLEKFFVEDLDYKVQKLTPPIGGDAFEGNNQDKTIFQQQVENKEERVLRRSPQNPFEGGRPKETIMLNINTFKKFCLKAGTKKADEVHDYYIKLEELLQETINEESTELKLQLSNKEEEHKKSINEIEKLNKQLHKRYEPRIITEEKFVLYLLVAYINGKTIYIIGKTADINKRYRSYRLKGILMHEEDIKLVYYKSCRSSIILNQVENCVILNMSEYIVEGTREVFETTELNETEMIDNFKQVIDFYIDSFKHVSPHITILNRDTKEEARIRTEMYAEENRDEINEKAREDRVENPEKFQEREQNRDPEKKKEKNKRYYENHKEEISEYHANYRSIPENREKINLRRKNVQNLTDEQIEEKTQKAKEYREKNKARRKEVSSQKIKCLVCESIFSRQCWKRHTKSTLHCDVLKTKPDVKEEYEVVEEEVVE